MKKLRAACIQTSAGRDFEINLRRALNLWQTALTKRPAVVVFPETFLLRGSRSELRQAAGKQMPRAVEIFRSEAARTKTAVVLGSVAESSGDRQRPYNTSIYIDAQGRIRAAYRKLHLFDVCLNDNVLQRESSVMSPGREPVMTSVRGVRAGLSICFDLRFPELYRWYRGQGARLLFVPSNFTRETGRVHWHTLIRARAVENQCFVLAPNQAGRHPGQGAASYGHSLVAGPWGETLAEAGRTLHSVIWADLDLEGQIRLRRRFPLHSARCLEVRRRA